jgi:hypothetical protein
MTQVFELQAGGDAFLIVQRATLIALNDALPARQPPPFPATLNFSRALPILGYGRQDDGRVNRLALFMRVAATVASGGPWAWEFP